MARKGARLVWRTVLWFVVVVTLLGTVLLTVPRLIEPTGARGIELVALTPIGLAPSVVLLIAALALVALHRGAARLSGVVLALTGLLATALHAVWLAPLYTGDQAAAGGEAGLVVMTQNLEYGDADALAAEVRDRHVDVLVLCDLGESQSAAVRASAIPRELPYVADAEGGAVAYSRYPLTGDTPIPLHGSGRSVRLESSPLGAVTLFALHPVQPYRPGVWEEDAARLVGTLRSRLAERDGSSTIVAGDLNATLDHRPLRQLEALGLTDAVDAVNGGFQPTYPASGHERRFGISVPPLFQIDHVLVSRGLAVTSVDRVATPGADHLGVVATIREAG